LASAVASNGYVKETNAARVFATQALGSLPLYRLWSSTVGDHFYTTSAEEAETALVSDGYSYEGVAGYVYGDDSCAGTVPLYRAYSASVGDHFYTTSAVEFNSAIGVSGYTSEGVAAFVLPA
jgi:hypothetical protein